MIERTTQERPLTERARPISERVDRHLRSNESVFASLANSICSLEGEDYLNSRHKRAFDLAFAAPAAIAASPFIAALGVAIKKEDGGPAFFTQERIGRPGKEAGLTIIKMRCMEEGSDRGKENVKITRGRLADEDSRNTRMGIFMRKHQLDELPQLFQVVQGKLSMFGLRPAPEYIFEYLQENWSKKRFNKWKEAYESGELGLSGLNQAMGSSLKEDEKRYHYDVFYVNNASLGLDLYLIWKTFSRLAKLS